MLKSQSKIILISLVVLLLYSAIFSQTATKMGELDSFYHCGNALHKFAEYGETLKNNPQNKLYVIYYEGQYRSTSVYDDKARKFIPKLVFSVFGDALNKAKGIPLFLKKAYKIPANRVVLVDGGFRQKLELEIWSVPEGIEPPKPTPTLQRKDIKFAKGKPFNTKDLSRCYEGF